MRQFHAVHDGGGGPHDSRADRIGFGVRAYFGQESLKANDGGGTSLDMPRYLGWNAQIAGTLE